VITYSTGYSAMIRDRGDRVGHVGTTEMRRKAGAFTT